MKIKNFIKVFVTLSFVTSFIVSSNKNDIINNPKTIKTSSHSLQEKNTDNNYNFKVVKNTNYKLNTDNKDTDNVNNNIYSYILAGLIGVVVVASLILVMVLGINYFALTKSKPAKSAGHVYTLEEVQQLPGCERNTALEALLLCQRKSENEFLEQVKETTRQQNELNALSGLPISTEKESSHDSVSQVSVSNNTTVKTRSTDIESSGATKSLDSKKLQTISEENPIVHEPFRFPKHPAPRRLVTEIPRKSAMDKWLQEPWTTKYKTKEGLIPTSFEIDNGAIISRDQFNTIFGIRNNDIKIGKTTYSTKTLYEKTFLLSKGYENLMKKETDYIRLSLDKNNKINMVSVSKYSMKFVEEMEKAASTMPSVIIGDDFDHQFSHKQMHRRFAIIELINNLNKYFSNSHWRTSK